MKITRRQVKIAYDQVQRFLDKEIKLGTKSIIFIAAKKICRCSEITINHPRNLKIEFFNIENGHWAETDGEIIYLNANKNYSQEVLYYTILHEILHGYILRNKHHEISEHLEHRIMELIDKKLV